MGIHLEVSLGLWQDRPPGEVVDTAALADSLGYRAVWIGEMATWDAFALATHIGATLRHSSLVLGPLAVAVRDPAMIAVGVASVAALTGREVAVALGTSSTTVVEAWHGRSRRRPGLALLESAAAVRGLLAGRRSGPDGDVVRGHGFRLRLPPSSAELIVAAFGPMAIAAAAAHADTMVLNLVDPAAVRALTGQLTRSADVIGRPRPQVAVWATCAVDPGPEALEQLRRGVVGYLAAPGYADMFAAAGFGELVAFAATGPHPRDLLAAVPAELVAAVGLIGKRDTVRNRMIEYFAAGADRLVIVPSATDQDPAGAITLRVAAEIARELELSAPGTPAPPPTTPLPRAVLASGVSP